MGNQDIPSVYQLHHHQVQRHRESCINQNSSRMSSLLRIRKLPNVLMTQSRGMAAENVNFPKPSSRRRSTPSTTPSTLSNSPASAPPSCTRDTSSFSKLRATQNDDK